MFASKLLFALLYLAHRKSAHCPRKGDVQLFNPPIFYSNLPIDIVAMGTILTSLMLHLKPPRQARRQTIIYVIATGLLKSTHIPNFLVTMFNINLVAKHLINKA